MSELRIVHAQDDRYYVVDRMQHTYGSPNGFATREAARAVLDEFGEVTDDE